MLRLPLSFVGLVYVFLSFVCCSLSAATLTPDQPGGRLLPPGPGSPVTAVSSLAGPCAVIAPSWGLRSFDIYYFLEVQYSLHYFKGTVLLSETSNHQ